MMSVYLFSRPGLPTPAVTSHRRSRTVLYKPKRQYKKSHPSVSFIHRISDTWNLFPRETRSAMNEKMFKARANSFFME